MRDMTEPFDTYDDDQGDYDWDYDAEERPPRPKILWGRVLSLVGFVLIGFLLGRWSASGGPSEQELGDLEARVTALETENADLEQQLAEAQAALDNQANENTGGGGGNDAGTEEEEEGNTGNVSEGAEYTVEEGDTLNAIVDDHYGCLAVENDEGTTVNLVDNVLDAETNSPVGNSPLAVGQDLLLPPVPDGYECVS